MLSGHPLVGRAVLVQHHPLERRSLATPAVLAPPRCLRHQSGALQRVLHSGELCVPAW